MITNNDTTLVDKRPTAKNQTRGPQQRINRINHKTTLNVARLQTNNPG